MDRVGHGYCRDWCRPLEGFQIPRGHAEYAPWNAEGQRRQLYSFLSTVNCGGAFEYIVSLLEVGPFFYTFILSVSLLS